MVERFSRLSYAIVPAVIALAIGLWGLSATGPWLDEMFTIEAVTDGLATHVWDAPMLPYYGFIWLWTLGGSIVDAWWIRVPSVIAVSATAFLVAVTARRLTTRRAGLVAGLLVALAPAVSRYAQEARTYAIALALVSLSTLALILLAEDPRDRWWRVYGVALALGALVLPVSLAVLPAHAVILATYDEPRRWRRWGAGLLVTVPVIALEGALAVVFGSTRAWLRVPELGDLPLSVTMLAGSGAFGLALLIVGLLTPRGRWWILGIGLSVLAIWLTSVTVSNWWLERSFIPLAGLAFVAAGLAFAHLAAPWIAGTLALLVVLALPPLGSMRAPGSRGADPEALAALVDRHALADDAILSPGDLQYMWWDADDADRTILWWSVSHLLRDDPRGLTRITTPIRDRYWESGEAVTCRDGREWILPAGDRLRLCNG